MPLSRHRPARVFSLLLLLALPVGCGPDGSADASDPDGSAGAPEPVVGPTAGRLVIVGGALKADNEAVYRAVLDGREGGGPLCVLPTASGVPDESMASAVETLTGWAGEGSAKGIPITTEAPELARDPAVVEELAACSGYFFTGGVQSRVVDVFLPGGDTTEAYRAVRHRWEEGAVIAGTSAGAAMMSRVMIAGGSGAGAVEHGVIADPDGDGVALATGMDFFDRAILDQHFLARGRIGRLLVVALEAGTPGVGLGIDENTALVVDGASAEVAGASGVVVVDARSARRTGANRATDIRVELAGAGDAIDLRTFQVRRSEAKVAVPVEIGGSGAADRAVGSDADGGLDLPDDPFARWAFLHLTVDLAESAADEATFQVPGAVLTVSEGQGFSASMAAATGGVEGAPSGFSAGPFRVDLVAPGS